MMASDPASSKRPHEGYAGDHDPDSISTDAACPKRMRLDVQRPSDSNGEEDDGSALRVTAAVFHGVDGDERGRRLVLQRFRAPQLQDGEMLVRIVLATICGSDVSTYVGKRMEPFPSVLGHEAVAVVVATGGATCERRIGERVTFSITDVCGRCYMCRHEDLSQKCKTVFKYGHAMLSDGSGLNGCYASHVLLRKGTKTVVIPSSISDAAAAPVNCALATVVAALRAVPPAGSVDIEDGICFNRRLAVVQGAGLLGLYACALLRDIGFHEVRCVDVNAERMKLAERFGADGSTAGDSSSNIVWRGEDGCADVVVEVCELPMLSGRESVFFVPLVHMSLWAWCIQQHHFRK
eukprot:Opistho-2@35618